MTVIERKQQWLELRSDITTLFHLSLLRGDCFFWDLWIKLKLLLIMTVTV